MRQFSSGTRCGSTGPALVALLAVALLALAGCGTPDTRAAVEPTPRAYVPLIVRDDPAARDVAGDVLLRPVYAVVAETRPIQYVVVLDTSYQRNLNFAGEAKASNGDVLQCAPSSDAARQAKYRQDQARCQLRPQWSPIGERRIAVAKAALTRLIDLMHPYDAMQVLGFSARAGDTGVAATTTAWYYGTPAGKQVLKDAVQLAGATAGDPNTTAGGRPSATGLDLARQLLANAPAMSTDGRDFAQAVLFMTNGVANHFLETDNSSAGFGWYNDAHDNPACKTLWNRDDAPECQIGSTATNPAIARPISAMVTAAAAIKRLQGGYPLVYVVALGDFPTAGLDEVATQDTFPYYTETRRASDVDEILQAIGSSGDVITCTPHGGAAWLAAIDSTHTVTDTAEREKFGLPADESIYGYAYLSDTSGRMLQVAPIRHDRKTGKLGYTFAEVAPGTYYQQAYVAYRGDDQPERVSRSYDSILFPNLSHDARRTVTIGPASAGEPAPLDPLYLDLRGTVCP